MYMPNGRFWSSVSEARCLTIGLRVTRQIRIVSVGFFVLLAAMREIVFIKGNTHRQTIKLVSQAFLVNRIDGFFLGIVGVVFRFHYAIAFGERYIFLNCKSIWDNAGYFNGRCNFLE